MRYLIFILICLNTYFLEAQERYFTKEGNITFFSSTPIEDIEAVNRKATSVLDASTGNIEWAVLIKAFIFEKALMQEHFNENYLESDKFPKANFKGVVQNMDAINMKKDGTYKQKVKGNLTIRDVTQPVETEATFTVKGAKVSASCTFEIVVADYKIKIPSVVTDKIAKTLEITVQADYAPLNR